MKRTQTKSIGELLEKLFSSPDIRMKIAEGSLPDTWRKVVGPQISASTKQVRLVRGTLYVHVESSVIRSQLMLQRNALVAALNQKAGLHIVNDVIIQ